MGLKNYCSMRKILLISLVAMLPLMTMAQNKQENDESVNSKAPWKGFVTNRFGTTGLFP